MLIPPEPGANPRLPARSCFSFSYIVRLSGPRRSQVSYRPINADHGAKIRRVCFINPSPAWCATELTPWQDGSSAIEPLVLLMVPNMTPWRVNAFPTRCSRWRIRDSAQALNPIKSRLGHGSAVWRWRMSGYRAALFIQLHVAAVEQRPSGRQEIPHAHPSASPSPIGLVQH